MPFVLGRDISLDRQIKKRKLFHTASMAGSGGGSQQNDTQKNQEEAQKDQKAQQPPAPEQKVFEKQPDEIRTSSREELIECIKRGQKPTWVPKPGLQALREEEEALQERRNAQLREQKVHEVVNQNQEEERNLSEQPPNPQRSSSTDPIERPRSALHSGDFSDPPLTTAAHFCRQHGHDVSFSPNSLASFGSSPPPWLSTSPPQGSLSTVLNPHGLQRLDTVNFGRQRAPSLGSSLSSSFVMRTPTSPLVHATNNPYLDLPIEGRSKTLSTEQGRSNRRRTLPPHSFQSTSTSSFATTPPNFSRPLPSAPLRRESSMPHQTHQARRSLSSFTYQPRQSHQTPPPRTRRLSLASDASSRRRSSMVGSFEESILRGRMSTPPSKPLDFVAQIGVMGKGDCSSSLKCPAHVSVPFPAVFYSYPAAYGSRSLADDTPSPYVGTIDLAHNLKPVELDTKRRKSERVISKNGSPPFTLNNDSSEHGRSSTPGEATYNSKSPSSISIGGAYRVPKQGQLQIIIKNPNKTAVKLFLVPYDLEGMEAGTKTFVRQRSFSSGPIIENALIDKTGKQATLDPLEDKLILRYLIHLKFCCPSKGRYYLHDNIRVVFANRVPDDKEKLRNDIQVPDPKFGTYKPDSVPLQSKSSRSSPATPSMTPSFGSPSRFFGDIDGLGESSPLHIEAITRPQKPREPIIPFHFSNSPIWNSTISTVPQANTGFERSTSFQFPDARPFGPESSRPERTLSPVAGFKAAASSSTRVSPIPWMSSSESSTSRSFSPTPIEVGNGLLSRQFRELNGTLKRSDDDAKMMGRSNTSESFGNAGTGEEMPSEGDIGLAKVVSNSSRDT